VHTSLSLDGVNRPREMVKYAKKAGLDAVAITDHNHLFPWQEAIRLSREFNITVIPGIEGGHIALEKHWIGIGIRNSPVLQTIGDTIRRVHREGGVAIAPHPFTRLGYDNYDTLGFGVVESLNGTEPVASKKVPHIRGISEVAGSDAHTALMLGFCWTFVDACDSVEDILEAVRKGLCSPRGVRIPVSLCLHHYGAYFTYRIMGRPFGLLKQAVRIGDLVTSREGGVL
jgi:predicted metal-dependent phosphoesterase TrpH